MSNLPSSRELEEASELEESADRRLTALSTPTYIGIALDRSGSMFRIREATVAGLNAYVRSLQNEGVAGAVSLTLFDTDGYPKERICLQRVWNALPIEQIRPLNESDYSPRGGTPLYDAIGRLIADMEREALGAEKIVCVIQTDGQETSSEEFDLSTVRRLIARKQELGWLFIFLGADVDAFGFAQDFGIAPGQALTYSGRKSTDAFAALSRSTVSYAATSDAKLSAFTDAERAQAVERLGSGKR